MLALLGLLTVGAMLALILTNRVTPLAALVLVPVLTALAAGFGWHVLDFLASGLVSIAPTAVMFVFAILFFGIVPEPLFNLVRGAGSALGLL